MALARFKFALILTLKAVACPAVAAESADAASSSGKSEVDDVLGVTFDTGIGKERAGASSIGARFVRLHPITGSASEPGAAWLGYGMDARVATIGFRSLDGVLVNLAGRAGVGAGAAGLELEPVVGVALGDRLLPTWGFAVLYGFPWFGVGISAQFPIATERPEWLETVGFAFRFQLPLRPCRSQFSSCSTRSR